MGEHSGKIESRLDNWLVNFSGPVEKRLAIKAFLHLDYFSEDRVARILARRKLRITQHLAAKGKTWGDVILVTPSGHADSSHFHAYTLTKHWGLSPASVLGADRLNQASVRDKLLLFFNDTHGSERATMTSYGLLDSP